MAYDGVTAGGELAKKGEGKTLSTKLDIEASDPNFMFKLAEKRPAGWQRFIAGAGGFPRDVALFLSWCQLRAGLFGGDAQARAKEIGDRLDEAFLWALNNPTIAYRIISIITGHAVENSGLYGRTLGGVITSYIPSGKTLRRVKMFSRRNLGTAFVMFLMASTGAGLRAVAQGGDTLGAMWIAFTGLQMPVSEAARIGREIQQHAQQLTLDPSPEGIQEMKEKIEGMRQLLKEYQSFTIE